MKEAIQISENFIKGDPVTSVDQLMDLAYNKKSIYHSLYKIKPAAIIMSMQFSQVVKMINSEQIFTTIKLVKLKTNKK